MASGLGVPDMTMPPDAQAVLDFWFGDADAERVEWFRRSKAFDDEIARRFARVHEAAERGELHSWVEDRDAALALVIVLDQFSRNLHRGSPRAFACDAQALAIARDFIERGRDLALPRLSVIRRSFVCMPFEHAEDLPTQDESVRLFEALAKDAPPAHERTMRSSLDYARRHRDVIRRFGRFPHRNEVLGRASTPQEIEFLRLPGSRF